MSKCKIICSVFAIFTDYGWYYYQCVKCDKTAYIVPKVEGEKSKQKKTLFWCPDCTEDVVKVIPRFDLNFVLIVCKNFNVITPILIVQIADTSCISEWWIQQVIQFVYFLTRLLMISSRYPLLSYWMESSKRYFYINIYNKSSVYTFYYYITNI